MRRNIKNKNLVYTIIAIVFIVGFFLMRWSITGNIILNDGIVTAERFKVINLDKSPNSLLQVRVSTSKLSTILVETEDCDKWKEGQDDDYVVMDKYENVRDIRFNIGDPSLNTLQQIELYKANKFCLIVGNLEDRENRINVDTKEWLKDKWNIVE